MDEKSTSAHIRAVINNPVRRVITDSRSHAGDQAELFVALVTPLADGHEYIPELYADGVRYFLVSGDTDYRSLYPEATFFQKITT